MTTRTATRRSILFVCLPLLLACGCAGKEGYLRKVLRNLEQVGSASYELRCDTYVPGDTIPCVSYSFCKEFDLPADTTIGAAFVQFDAEDTARFESGYDGRIHACAEHADRKIVVDDFTARPLPFRPVTPPFFNQAKSIVRYILTTDDRIETQLAEEGDDYRIRLVIREDRQVEFFGAPYSIPAEIWDPTSVYEIWIRKSDDMPYRIRREMAHDITVRTISGEKTGRQAKPLRLAEFYPAHYRIVKYGERSEARPAFDNTGRKAPAWVLDDANGNPVSLDDFKSRLLLIEFTGIGCGHCHEAIPFLNRLKDRYPAGTLDLVAIETWGKRGSSIRVYSERNDLKYPMLQGTAEVCRAYMPDNAVPVFILVDEQRIIRHIFSGYGKGTTDHAVTEAIDDLLPDTDRHH